MQRTSYASLNIIAISKLMQEEHISMALSPGINKKKKLVDLVCRINLKEFFFKKRTLIDNLSLLKRSKTILN